MKKLKKFIIPSLKGSAIVLFLFARSGCNNNQLSEINSSENQELTKFIQENEGLFSGIDDDDFIQAIHQSIKEKEVDLLLNSADIGGYRYFSHEPYEDAMGRKGVRIYCIGKGTCSVSYSAMVSGGSFGETSVKKIIMYLNSPEEGYPIYVGDSLIRCNNQAEECFILTNAEQLSTQN
jgi:hypothetical protein